MRRASSSDFVVSGSSATSNTRLDNDVRLKLQETGCRMRLLGQSECIYHRQLQEMHRSLSAAAACSVIGRPHDAALLLVESALVGLAKYLKSPLLNYDVLATAAWHACVYSFRRRASSCSRAQYTYRTTRVVMIAVKGLMLKNGTI